MNKPPPAGTLMIDHERRGLAVGTARRRKPPTARRIALRRWMIGLTKRLLPLLALCLLASIVLWPEFSRWADQARMRAGRLAAQMQSGVMTKAVYHGVDQRGRPYTVTANEAREVSPERVDLTRPKGDVTLESGRWLMVQSKQGTYMQHLGNLDLSGDVQLYRDDGTTMTTDSANVDLKAGAAAGSHMVHVEGPFGPLDAQGFTLTDRGSAIQFAGPGRLVLNARR